ncbi:MAG: hypothetical protein HZA92_12305 [Verrucomicrobia bacterium]|nr:hypothetical protein [Verrucomicrobiota bacterium]
MVIKWEKRLLKSATAGPETLPVPKVIVVGVEKSGEVDALDGERLEGRFSVQIWASGLTGNGKGSSATRPTTR